MKHVAERKLEIEYDLLKISNSLFRLILELEDMDLTPVLTSLDNNIIGVIEQLESIDLTKKEGNEELFNLLEEADKDFFKELEKEKQKDLKELKKKLKNI